MGTVIKDLISSSGISRLLETEKHTAKTIKPFLIIVFLAVILGFLFCIGCDGGPKITYRNDTQSTLWIDLDGVSKSFTGWHKPRIEITDRGPILPGQSRGFDYIEVPMEKEMGKRVKYAITAIAKDSAEDEGLAVWQRIFTWTELDALDWKIVIEPQ